MTTPTHLRHLMDAREVSAATGVPAGTIYGWKSKGRLTPADVLPDGTVLYDVREVAALAATTARRKRKERT